MFSTKIQPVFHPCEFKHHSTATFPSLATYIFGSIGVKPPMLAHEAKNGKFYPLSILKTRLKVNFFNKHLNNHEARTLKAVIYLLVYQI